MLIGLHHRVDNNASNETTCGSVDGSDVDNETVDIPYLLDDLRVFPLNYDIHDGLVEACKMYDLWEWGHQVADNNSWFF